MKIKVDNENVLELSETMIKVIKNDIDSECFEDDMKRRIKWVLTHKYERCMERLKRDWEQKLRERYASIPTSEEALAELIFTQPDYKNRSQREAANAPLTSAPVA